MNAETPTGASAMNDGPLSPALQERPSPLSTPTATGNDGPQDSATSSLSTIFHPGNQAISPPPDCAVKSSDGILFYVNSDVLVNAGALNIPYTLVHEGRPVDPGLVAQVPESSPVLTVILCAVYGISCESTAPSIDDISTALDRMPFNGFRPKLLIQKTNPLYTLLMTHHAPVRPLAVYTIAAHHDIEPLARDASAYLLGLEVEDIDNTSTARMGSSYFMKLLLLSTNRVKALRRIVRETTPGLHPPQPGTACDEETQQQTRTHWERTVITLTWDDKSDISPSTIRETCRLASEGLSCAMCKNSWNDCVEEVITQWEQVKSTI